MKKNLAELINIVANNDRLLEKAQNDSEKQNENVQKINEILLKIKILDSSVYEKYVK